jgi:predicted dehydrogenase
MRWGICGTGAIASKFVTGLANVRDAECVAVASRTPGRAGRFAAEHGIGRAHDSWEALAADDGVDVVYVAATQDAHRDATVLMLEAGRHVLCEKPLAMSEAQAAEMVAVARRHGRFLMEAMWSRFSPAYVALGEVLASERIGTVRQVRADLSLRVEPAEREGHRLFDPGRGGGALLDVGIYPLQLASLVLGPPTTVLAAGVLGQGRHRVDEQVGLLLGHRGGGLAVLTAAISVAGPRTARIEGDLGAIDITRPMHAPTSLEVTVARHSKGAGDVEVIECGAPGLWRQVPEVHRCIDEGLLESPVMSWTESLGLQRTADEARRQLGLSYPWE